MSVPPWHPGTGTLGDCYLGFNTNDSAYMMHSSVIKASELFVQACPKYHVTVCKCNCANEPARYSFRKKNYYCFTLHN